MTDTFWTFFTLVPMVVFIVAETIAVRTKTVTYSEAIRRWLGIRPRNTRRRVLVLAFVLGYSAFTGWFVPHIISP